MIKSPIPSSSSIELVSIVKIESSYMSPIIWGLPEGESFSSTIKNEKSVNVSLFPSSVTLIITE